jgi:hypothetical protein
MGQGTGGRRRSPRAGMGRALGIGCPLGSAAAALVVGLLVVRVARGADAPASPAKDGGTNEGGTSNRQGEPLSVVFDMSAERLPQAEIRAAIQQELGRPIATPYDTVTEWLSVHVDSAGGLVLEFRTRGSVIERHVPLPSRPEDVPLVVALLAGNLVRDQRYALPGPPSTTPVTTDEPQAPPAPPPRAEPRERAEPRLAPKPSPPHTARGHWLGFHVAQDVAMVGGSNVCDPNLGQMSDSYACFLAGTDDRPFTHTPYPLTDGFSDGLVVATTRVLVSYDYSLLRHVSAGGRLGYAFGGGPPAGQTPATDGTGSGGTAFFPFHAEVRLTLWILPPSAPFSAYLGASGGIAQVDAKTTVNERDCTTDAQFGLPDASEEAAFEACRIASADFDWTALPAVKVDAWKKLGQGFYGLHLGAGVALTERLRAVANVNLMFFTPATGVVFEPSLGVMLGI